MKIRIRNLWTRHHGMFIALGCIWGQYGYHRGRWMVELTVLNFTLQIMWGQARFGINENRKT